MFVPALELSKLKIWEGLRAVADSYTFTREKWGDCAERVRYVSNLVEKGYARQILLSHDVAFRSMLQANGGSGYSYVVTDFIPRLQAAGLSDEHIHTLLVENPRRALTGEA